MNITQPMGAVISAQLATLHELDTVYSVEDMWKLLEVASIDRYNQSVMAGK
ncbi:hypothetical protein LMG33818_000053 [Halomonadaceae bacterium LMG 33818]|uniref:hypothetical protein n=1 Tax=Cernens ardua TaxID=3402176 RepID=UPI003EDB747A